MPRYPIRFSELTSKVQRFERDGVSFWIVRDTTQSVIALRDRCAHQGAKLRPTDHGFVCPAHNWQYSLEGTNKNRNLPCLDRLKVNITDDVINVEVPSDRELLPWYGEFLDGSETMKLLAHSSFLLEVDEKKILFDPWLFGDAYWGSWSLWPKYEIADSDLELLTDVVISHPHPDHFHLPTMQRLARHVRVHYPPFLSKIIPTELNKLGFRNLNEAWWEQEIDIGSGVRFAFLRPTSFWEDSAVLVRVRNWVWLNQNDAGAPLTDARFPNINLLSTGFDGAASGYPITWMIDEKKKKQIMKGKKARTLALISERCKQLEVPYFAPFASWWRHSHPQQEEFERSIWHVSMGDLRLALSDGETELLETYPSASINLKSMAVECKKEKLDFEMPVRNKGEWLEGRKDLFDVRNQLRDNLLQLARMSTAVDCESVVFIVRIDSSIEPIEVHFGSESKEEITIEVAIPGFIADLLVSGDKSVTWDSVAIGYWGRWRRQPDVYPGAFMRLLQLGYVSELESCRDIANANFGWIMNTSIAKLLETDFGTAAKILNRYGLPCTSCGRSSSETVRDAIAIHSISDSNAQALARELGVMMEAKCNNGA